MKNITSLLLTLALSSSVLSQHDTKYKQNVLHFFKNCNVYGSIVGTSNALLIISPKTKNSQSGKEDCTVFSEWERDVANISLKDKFDFTHFDTSSIILNQNLFDSTKMLVGAQKVNRNKRAVSLIQFQNPLFSKKLDYCLFSHCWYGNSLPTMFL